MFDGASRAYRFALVAVIGINAIGFLAMSAGAIAQGSAALAGNGLDFLGDAATYALSLWAIGRAPEVRAGAALAKACSMAFLALSVIGFTAWRLVVPSAPDGAVVSGFGALGVGANLAAAALLLRWRDGDANVRSVWLCTRNDVIHCVAAVAAGGLVALTHTRWPDAAVGALLAAVFLRSAWQIGVQAQGELRVATAPFPNHAPAQFVISPRRTTATS